MNKDPLAPRAPFDVASVEAARVEAASKADTTPSLPLPIRLQNYLHSLPFLPSSSILILTLLLLGALHTTGLLLFTRGFLLTRLALEDVNTCNPIATSGNLDASCSLPPTHSKLVFIIIDALRADFVLPVETNASASLPSKWHHNRLTLPSRLTKSDPSRSFLSHFIADAPTTTLQRLKGLTTGSLPTFVDAGSNFGGERVGEDNWLRQAKRAGKRIALIGDDTWLAVFPKTAGGVGGVWQEESVWAYDSFNVEDLDTVDQGVVRQLLPLLDESKKGKKTSWDIIIAHTLGLDHAGHRFGPSHAEAARKLDEAERLLSDVVDRMDDDTLLVVMGDHGMTDRGDHGGDSREEIDAALWIYSNGPILTDASWFDHPLDSPRHVIAPLFESARSSGDFEDRLELDWSSKGIKSTRSVSQVDIVPTLSLLLGLPIPFGSLGLVIPELFYHSSSLPVAPVPGDEPAAAKPAPKRNFFGRMLNDDVPTQRSEETLLPLSTLLQASVLTSSQLSHYLTAYIATSSGSDFRPAMPELTFILSLAKSAFRGAYAPGAVQKEMELKAITKFWTYGRKAREKARKVWARFDESMMIAGLTIWIGSIAVGYKLFATTERGAGARNLLGRALEGSIVALWITTALRLLNVTALIGGLSPARIGFVVALGAEIGILLAPSGSSSAVFAPVEAKFQYLHYAQHYLLPILPLVAHSALFASNSFTVYEDSSIVFILSSILIITFLRSLSAPQARLRKRLVGFTLVALVCVRLMSYSTVCREEQAPFCTPTFDIATPGSYAALLVIALTFGAAWTIPTLLRRSLSLSLADTEVSQVFFDYGLRALLVGGVLYRLADWMIGASIGGAEANHLAAMLKTGVARMILIGGSLTAALIWHTLSLCITVEKKEETGAGDSKRTIVSIRGFANTFGSAYLIFFASMFAIVFLVNTPSGQLALSLHLVTLLCLLEIFDSERDVAHMKASFATLSIESLLSSSPTELPTATSHDGPTFLQLSTLALLSHLSFFATGHQASFSTIQWNSAFVGFPSILYPISPLLVILNTLGSHFITALAIPLFVFWNVTPTLADQPALPLVRNLLRAGVGYATYQATVSFATALFAGVLRRHLMVWKIFAPRFMLGGVSLLMVDFTLAVFAMGWAALATLRKVKARLGTNVVE